MDISWNNIDNLEDYFITYLLYTESKTVSQISKIRNISVTEVNDHLIRAKLDIKSVNKRRGDPDQAGTGRKARRGRQPARCQGVPLDRQDPPQHHRRGPDLSPAPPRHLLHRGPGRAHLRPEERQPPRQHQRQAGQRGRCWHHCRRRCQGRRTGHSRLRLRRRHRRGTPHLHQARRPALGAGHWPRPTRP